MILSYPDLRAAHPHLTCLLLMLSFLAGASPPAKAQGDRDWPMERRDAANTSFVPDTLHFPLKLTWRRRLEPGQHSRLLASGGILCLTRTAGTDSEAVLYDVKSGRIRTRISGATALYLKKETLILLSSGSESTPAKVWRYDWKTKRQVWECTLGGKNDGCWGGVESKGCFYLACTLSAVKAAITDAAVPGVHLIALDFGTGAVTGRVVGSRERESGILPAGARMEAGWGYGPPAVDKEVVVLGISHGLYFFRPQTLMTAAPALYDGGNYFPLLTDTHVLTQGWQYHVNGLRRDRTGGWTLSAPRGTAHSIARTADGKAVLVESLSQPAGLAGIEPDSGKIRWRSPLLAGSVAGANNVFVLSGWNNAVPDKNKPGQMVPPAQTDGGFYAVDAATGKHLWKYTRPGMRIDSVIISDGGVYGLTADGWLYRFDSHRQAPRQVTIWP